MTEEQYFWIIAGTAAAVVIFILYLRGSDPLPDRDPSCIWHTTVFKIDRVYDGDTFFAHVRGHNPIDKKPIGIRIRGIDTPEIKSKKKAVKKKAEKAKAVVEKRLKKARRVHLYNISMKDKYGRMLATVFCDRRDLSKILIEKKLAKPYAGGKKSKW
jgi:micrococcal nuclease